MPSRSDFPKPSRLWWIYFCYLVLCMVLYIHGWVHLIKLPGNANLAQVANVVNLPLVLAISVATFALDAWAIVGFWGFLRSRPFGAAGVWRVCCAMQLVAVVLPIVVAIRAGTPPAILTTAGLMLKLPLLIALSRYAWLSPHLWKQLPTAANTA